MTAGSLASAYTEGRRGAGVNEGLVDTGIAGAAAEGGSGWLARRRTDRRHHYKSPLLLLQTPHLGRLHGEGKHINVEPAFSQPRRPGGPGGCAWQLFPSPRGPPASRSPHPTSPHPAESPSSTRSPCTAKGAHQGRSCWIQPPGSLEPDPEPELQRRKTNAPLSM